MTVTANSRHLTASAVVIDVAADKVLLVHHNATGKWVFPGGHVDPDEAPDEAARREVLEETGVSIALIGGPDDNLSEGLGLISHPAPWRVDEHPAPAKPQRPGREAEPAHRHIDLLYIAQANSTQALSAAPAEVAAARWVPIPQLPKMLSECRAEVGTYTLAAYVRLTQERSRR